MKVLLLNPPGTRRYLRDYYCSHVSKGRYVWHPIDLLMISGRLAGIHDVLVVDAIAESLTPQETIRIVRRFRPESVIFLTGSVSWLEDARFLTDLAESANGETQFYGIGDLSTFEPGLFFEQFPYAQGILSDFISPAVVELLSGNQAQEGIGFLTRRGYDSGLKFTHLFPRSEDDSSGGYRVPLPQLGLFPLNRYHLAHLRYHPFASVLTDFGCPFRCRFCPYESIPFAIRNQENLFDELEMIHERGIREIWFKDQSFGSNRRHSRRIMAGMNQRRFGFSWSCETRVEYLDRETIQLMRESGCHTVMIGVESADFGIRSLAGKPIRESMLRQALSDARRAGIRTLIHYVLGLPGESLASLERIPDHAVSLDSDYASFNVATPQYGTTFRGEAIDRGWIDAGIRRNLDSSRSYPVLQRPELSPQRIWRLRSTALRKFYFRPRMIWRQIRNTRTRYQWRNLIRESWSLIRDLMG